MKVGVLFVLVIAHPDDESMFFLPTLFNLINDYGDTSNYHILCLSNGNYDGLGIKRTQELNRAAKIVSPLIEVTVMDHPQLRDGPNESWSKPVIEDVLIHFLETRNRNHKRLAQNLNACATQDVVLLTFDEGGVSGHINHIDTYEGLVEFFQKFTTKNKTRNRKRLESLSQSMSLNLLTLNTIYNPLQKYVPIFELLHILLCWIFPKVKMDSTNPLNAKEGKIAFRMFQPFLVWDAMSAHYTQFVWYRRLFVIFSIYSYTNTFNVVQLEKEGKKEI